MGKNKNYRRGIYTPAYEEGPNCEGCPFRKWSHGFVPPVGPEHGELYFIAEAPGPEEVKAGRPLVGGSGAVFNGLLRECTSIRRSSVRVGNTVLCRPIKWIDCPECKGEGCDAWSSEYGPVEFQCQNGKVPKINKYTWDFENAAPEGDQVDECVRRYLNEDLNRFKGRTIMGMGAIPLRAFARKGLSVTSYNGSVFEPGRAEPCEGCGGRGVRRVERVVRCRTCRGKPQYVDPGWRCEDHKRYSGKTRPKRQVHCELCEDLFDECWVQDCESCNNTGTVRTEREVKCGACKGEGVAWRKTDANLSPLLQDGQLYIQTFHPAYIMRNKTKRPAMEAVFRRLETLHDEDSITEGNYVYFPGEEEQFEWPEVVSVDIENPKDGDPRKDSYSIISVSRAPEESVVFRAGDPRILEAIEGRTVIGQNYTLHDAWWLYHNTGTVPARIFDTRFAGHLLNPDTPNNLTTLSVEYAIPAMRGYWKSQNNYKHRLETVCALDTDATFRVYEGQCKALKDAGQYDLMWEHIVPLSRVVLDMRIAGMKVDREAMVETKEAYLKTIAEKRGQLPFAGNELSHDVRKWLFDTCGIPQVNPREGERNTRAATLKETIKRIREGRIHSKTGEDETKIVEVLEEILTLRELSKLTSTFLSYELHDGDRIHPALNPAGAATLRLSCSDPNAQQIPEDTRRILIADDIDRRVTSIDISQAEVVVFLWLVEEWDLLDQVLDHGFDAHAVTAELVGCDRYTAKTSTFAILYGEEVKTTAMRLGISMSEAGDLHANYHQRMPGIHRLRESILDYCRDRGHVISPWGVKRYMYLEDGETKGHTVNQALNAPIQNGAAMSARVAMPYVAESLPNGARLWMQVHDEIIVEHDKGQTKEVSECLRESLHQAVSSKFLSGTNPYSAKTPRRALTFQTKMKSGPSWGEMSDISERV